MAKRLDQILTIDLESTCWDGDPPAGEVSEIIEIGICPVDVQSGKRMEKESIMVRPVKSKISPFCTQLTTITQADVDKGIPFTDAIKILEKKYDLKNRTMASYGDYDRIQLGKDSSLHNVQSPVGKTHLNVKNLAALMNGWTKEVGMDECLKKMGLPLVGTHHRGSDDAFNIASIMIALLFERGVTDVPTKSEA